MKKAELQSEVKKALAVMRKNREKGWKGFVKKSNLQTKRGPTLYYGGITKGDFTICINKSLIGRVYSTYYTTYVNKSAPMGLVTSDLVVGPTNNPYYAYTSQRKKIESHIEFLQTYIDSVQ